MSSAAYNNFHSVGDYCPAGWIKHAVLNQSKVMFHFNFFPKIFVVSPAEEELKAVETSRCLFKLSRIEKNSDKQSRKFRLSASLH